MLPEKDQRMGQEKVECRMAEQDKVYEGSEE
jgi:hypothetical protein